MNSILGLTWAQWGLLFIAFAFLFLFLRIFQRTRAVLVFLGICLCGGRIAAILAGLARSVSHLFDALAGKLFGVAVPGIILLLLGAVLIHDLHPKGGGASRRTFWISAFVACCLIAGVSAFQALNGIPGDVRTGVSTATGG
jgi:hypothetical protein